MEKQKTALMQLLHFIDDQIGKCPQSEMIKFHAKGLLELEKERMIQFAFDYHDEYLNNGEVPSPEDYYNETFES